MKVSAVDLIGASRIIRFKKGELHLSKKNLQLLSSRSSGQAHCIELYTFKRNL